MTGTLLLSILSGVSFAGAGLGYKMAERRQCRSSVFIFVFAVTGGAFAGMKAFSETTVWLDPKLWALGIAMGLLFDLAIYFIMQANRLGPASVSWTVLNLGLLVPIFLSPFIADEAVLWVDPNYCRAVYIDVIDVCTGDETYRRGGQRAPYSAYPDAVRNIPGSGFVFAGQ
jgi:hypothetical protein